MITREPPQASFRAHDNSGQRLIDLVDNGARKLAKRREAQGSCKFIPRIRERLLGGLLLGDIGDDTFQFDVAAWAKIELSYRGDIQRRAISLDDPVLVAERGLGADRRCERLLQGR